MPSSGSCGRAFGAVPRGNPIMRKPRTSFPYVIAICGILVVPFVGTTSGFAASPLSAIDTDKDGTVDLIETKTAAGALFDKLDKDNDGTLDLKEVRGRLSNKKFYESDPDQDKTLTKEEYLSLVEKAFKAADTDGDGTLDAKEFKTRSGQALLRLLRQ
jgi:EF-hand domain pair